jgi:hypothetical protein
MQSHFKKNILYLTSFLLLSLVLNWFYLKGGFNADDILILNMLHQDPLPFSWWKGFWSVTNLPGLTSIWWTDINLQVNTIGAFWRPIASLVFAGFIKLFGETALPLHLLSVLLHGAIAFTIFLIVRRITKKTLIPFIAGLLFLSCEDHSMVIGWIATMTDILCVFFINLSILFHMTWLKKRRIWALVSSLIAVALALGSKESAATAPLILILMTFLMPEGEEDEEITISFKTIRGRISSFFKNWYLWIPALVVLILYLTIYKTINIGGMNNLLYMDPLTQPGKYFSHLITNLPIMLFATLSILPPSISFFIPNTLIPFSICGLILFILWLWALLPAIRRPIVVWAMLVYFLVLLPQMGTDASERGLYVPFVAASILLAIPLVQIKPFAKRLKDKGFNAPVFTRIFGWYVLIGILITGLILSAFYPFYFAPSFSKPERDSLTAQSVIEKRNPDHVLVLNTSGPCLTFYMGGILEYHTGHQTDVRILSACNAIMSLERTGYSSFIIHADRKGWISNIFARMFRTKPILKKGRIYKNNLFSATLLELTPDEKDVLAVRFEMETSLDDKSLLFLYWDGSQFQSIDIAALTDGEKIMLADTSDVWKSMM